ncbi:MAG: hypothetical protein WCA76_20900 [Candidatus Sulfotelmatobacter sp.]
MSSLQSPYMPQGEIDDKRFADLLIAEFPQLREEVCEWHDLSHLQMMEFVIFTEKAGEAGDWSTVERCLELANRVLNQGNTEIRNAVHVSYLEHLPREGEVHERIRALMSPELRRAWENIQAYLASLRDIEP